MNADRKTAKFRYYGIAPFEIEVIYSALNGVFNVEEEQLPIEDTTLYVSRVEIEFPIPYGESFFEVFRIERWFKIKGLIKEMKRRRGCKKGLKALLCFCGIIPELKSRLIFSLLNKNNRQFEMAIEKIEYLVDIIPIQLKTLPADTKEVIYFYDEVKFKWTPQIAKSGEGSDHSHHYYNF